MWVLGASKTFNEFVLLATGKKLRADALLKNITAPIDEIMEKSKKRISRLRKVKPYQKAINLGAKINIVSGKKIITNNKKSFEDMAQKYKKWLRESL